MKHSEGMIFNGLEIQWKLSFARLQSSLLQPLINLPRLWPQFQNEDWIRVNPNWIVRIRVNPNPHCFIAITKAEATNLKDPLSKAENISRAYAVNRRQKYIPVRFLYTVKKKC
jgi:hypothetical protein